jgi:hypothetical protein
MIALNNGQRSNSIRLTKKGGKDAQDEMTAFAKYERSFSKARTSGIGRSRLCDRLRAELVLVAARVWVF